VTGVVGRQVAPGGHGGPAHSLDASHLFEGQVLSPVEGRRLGVPEGAGHPARICLCVRVQELLHLRMEV